MIATLLRDLRFASRSLRRTPAFTVVAVVTLALGVGANTAIFSVVNGVVLRPLPYAEPETLFLVERFESNGGFTTYSLSQPDVYDIQATAAIESAAGYHSATFTLTGGDRPEVIEAARVTKGFLDVFRLAPLHGRDLREDENVPGGPRVVVLSHAFWRERFGGDPSVVGRDIELSEVAYEIVGVAPAGFDYPGDVAVWVPRYHDLQGCGRGCHFFRMVARLAPGVSLTSAQAELSGLSERLQNAYPNSNFGKSFSLVALGETVYGSVRTGLYLLLGAVGLVLLIACANVANLLLVRGTTRGGELAVRSALGAGRGRLMGQLLIEAAVLSALGGTLGIVLAKVGLDSLLSLAPSSLPRLDEIGIDGTVMAFALTTVVVITLLFGLLPAWRVTRSSVAEVLQHAGRGDGSTAASGWSRSALLVGEVALSLMLLFAAGQTLRSFAALNAVDLGFDKERVSAFSISLPSARYGPDEAVAFFERLETRLHAVPGVVSAGSAFGSPLSSNSVGGSFTLLDRPPPPQGQEPGALVRAVTPGYLETLGVPILRGRGFASTDRQGAPLVALVSLQFVEEFFADRDPLGQTLDLHVSFGYPTDEPMTIVGVVGDIRSRNPRREPVAEIYVPQAQSGSDFLRVLVRSTPGAPDPVDAIRAEVRAMDPNVPLRSVETLSDAVDRAFGSARFYLTLLGIFAAVAVLMAAIGLYGVVAYLVSRRTREIGLRIALGADRGEVVRLVVRQGLRPAIVGIGLGLVGAWAAAQVLASVLYQINPRDPATLVGAAGLLLAVVVVATLMPAGRASRIEPVVALKDE